MKRIKTITSHAGLARWLSETSEDIVVGYLARCQTATIPSPYHYSPSTAILDWNGRKVVYFETSHRRYEVFEVPADMLTFKTDEEATEYHIKSLRKTSVPA